MRLSYYGNVAGKVPEVYMQIFPPKPEPQPLEATSPQDGNDAAMEDATSQMENSGKASQAEKKWALQFVLQVGFAYMHPASSTFHANSQSCNNFDR